MPHRRRHGSQRRALHPERPARPAQGDRREAKEAERRAAEFRAGQARIARRRDFIALLAIPILALVLACGTVPIPFACDLPREVLFFAFSAILGGWLGMTIRLFLEQRRYARDNEVRPSTS